MKILQFCTYDRGGGAETVAMDLLHAYQALGHDVRMIVRHKKGAHPQVLEADPYQHTAPWGPAAAAADRWVATQQRFRGQYRVRDWLQRSAWPQRWINHFSGAEDFSYPASQHVLDDQWCPDVIHAHNLHGDYFDLRALAPLSQRVPVIWTLHDTWALTGHCAYFIDCPRWQHGCGVCPDLQRAPAIRADRTAENWQRKRAIYAQSRLAIATPSQWLLDLVGQSMLKPWQQQVIPNGVDTRIYTIGDRQAARAALDIPADAFVVLYIAASVSSHNPYKDAATVVQAARQLASTHSDAPLLLIRIGAGGEPESDPRFRSTGYLADPQLIAQYYRAADLLLHAANADNYPCVIQEALACGTPVIATAVGGVPEQIHDGDNGFLVARGDSAAMAARMGELLNTPERLHALRASTAAHAARMLSTVACAERYLRWFTELRQTYAAEGSVWAPISSH
ncbi:MAG: glycosyltransferase [Roseiflexaceae bacterium]